MKEIINTFIKGIIPFLVIVLVIGLIIGFIQLAILYKTFNYISIGICVLITIYLLGLKE